MKENSMEKKKKKNSRQPMPEQLPELRARNFDEVPYGYSPEAAIKEAKRCLNCKKPGCISGCPVQVKIPEFLSLIAKGDFAAAARKVKETNALPAVSGRVCPQELQCESKCILGKKGEPIAIGNLERFCADYERENNLVELPEKSSLTGKKVAVIGSGPAGLTVAGDLLRLGHAVTIFEALHKTGGVLFYGIPEFRLPKAIVEAEVDFLERRGAKIKVDSIIGNIRTVDELLSKDGFDAAFIAVGAGLPSFIRIPGMNLSGVYSANEYLTRSNLMRAYLFPEYDTPLIFGKDVAVFGAGNVAMDAARTAMRLGAERVRIVYRRSREEMPARGAEIHHAEEEGIEFFLLTAPTRLFGDETGRLTGMECLKMELGEPDESGRRRPVPIEGSEFKLDCDLSVIAVGSGANPLLTKSTPSLDLNKWGYIVADPDTGKTTKKAVWAGGDIVTGQATVILAMGAGRKSAKSIHQYLTWGW